MSMTNDIQRLDDAIRAMPPLSQDIVVYRSVDSSMAARLRSLVGSNFYDEGYTTTNLHPPFGGNLRVEIFVPKGSHVMPTGSGEIVIPRTSKFTVLEETDDAIRLEYMG